MNDIKERKKEAVELIAPMAEVVLPNRRGLYDEFTALTPPSYGRVALIDELTTVLKEEFWDFVLELDAERQEVVLATLKNNPEIIFNLVKNSKENLILAFLKLPEKFKADLNDSFLQGAKMLSPGDSRRLLTARAFGKADFLNETELRELALKIKDGETEGILSSLNARQILVFASALGNEKLINLPDIIKRATVLAQVKSVICADTVADPKLKQVCSAGKWATVRTFGAKR